MSVSAEQLAAEWPRIVGFVRMRAPKAHPAVIEDIAAAALEKALRKRESFTPESLHGWLFVIVRTVYIDHWRREKRRQHMPIGEYGRATTDAGNDVHATVLDVRAALDRVPARYADYLRLRMDGAEQIETSKALGMASGKTSAHRHERDAFRLLRGALSEVAS